MNDIRNGKIYAALFILSLVLLIVGGYFLTVKVMSEDKKTPTTIPDEETASKTETLKINKDKDFIYFENSDSKSLEHEIIYQDIVLNFQSSNTNIIEKLNNEMNELRKTYKKISEQTITAEEEEKILYKEDDIYSATFRKYTRYFYKNYASLLVEEYDYNCFNGSTFKNSQSYVFDVSNGKTISKNELLNNYNKSIDSIKSTIKEKLEKNQTIVEEQELIDITATLNSLDNEENYALYINKSGFLCISYLVKTTQVDYNDVIILN